MNSPELLVPVNRKSLKLVGDFADSIYFGLSEFNMRMKAENFKKKDLPDIIEYCHNQENPLKAYLCTNVLVYNSELKEMEDLLKHAKKCGIDAVIVHDIAAIRFAKKYNLNFHVSTQANISNVESAKFYEKMGAERLILARELSLKQIKEIKNGLTTAQVECFVHGSMCTSISGRCYFSASVMGSSKYSANRGNCIQPCRRRWRVIDDMNNEFLYDGKLFLNAKDLCMIEYIPELIESNIDAFKIEGRMKDPLYIQTVAKCYREAIDSYMNGTFTKEKVNKWEDRLRKVYNRGFHTGFYFETPDIEDIELESRGNVNPYQKILIGKILSYNVYSKTANVEIQNLNQQLQIHDKIVISGKRTFFTQWIKKMIKGGKKVESIGRNPSERLKFINIVLEHPAHPDDEIFVLKKKY
ncbi:MAG: putative enzyme [Promethearchaeota archaeon]|nr:MAG: putative enzyme [Candidatus Lokiarchaeota archaeon]